MSGRMPFSRIKPSDVPTNLSRFLQQQSAVYDKLFKELHVQNTKLCEACDSVLAGTSVVFPLDSESDDDEYSLHSSPLDALTTFAEFLRQQMAFMQRLAKYIQSQKSYLSNVYRSLLPSPLDPESKKVESGDESSSKISTLDVPTKLPQFLLYQMFVWDVLAKHIHGQWAAHRDMYLFILSRTNAVDPSDFESRKCGG